MTFQTETLHIIHNLNHLHIPQYPYMIIDNGRKNSQVLLKKKESIQEKNDNKK